MKLTTPMKQTSLLVLLPTLITALAAYLAFAALAQDDGAPSEEGPPVDGYQQLMERGAIPALVDPEFVSAEEAEIPDDAWVLGFVFGGEAYAYDLNILNHHEVVNHRIGDTPVAAVW